MIATLSQPYATVRGLLSQSDGKYARMLGGKCVIQRRPNRKSHVPTAAELRNRERFKATCPGNKWRSIRPSPSDTDDHSVTTSS